MPNEPTDDLQVAPGSEEARPVDAVHDPENGKETGTSVSHASWTGPLPHPAALKAFDDLVPGSAEKLINNTLEESKHRRQMEIDELAFHREVLRGEISITRMGQFGGIGLGLLAIGGGIFLAATGKELTGFAAVLGGAATIIAGMIMNREIKNKTAEKTGDSVRSEQPAE